MAGSLLLLAGVACRRQSFSVNGQDVRSNLAKLHTQAPLGSTVKVIPEVAGALGAERTTFQTRSTMSLKVAGSIVQPGNTLTLLDLATKRTLINRQALAMGLTEPAGGLPFVASLTPYDVTVHLYPSDPAYRGAFAYGDNQLSLTVEDAGVGVHTSSLVVHLKDFPMFEPGSAMAFESPKERSDGGLEGGVPPFATAVVGSPDGGLLTSGLVSLINR